MAGFRNRTSKFGSLLSLGILIAMLLFFVANVPLFSGAAAGMGFAGVWLAVAIIVCVSHIVRVMPERRQPIILMAPGPKDARTRKHMPRVRALRG